MSRAAELIRLLYLSADYVDGNESRNHITGLEHSLRVATLAHRHDPNDLEMIFVALVHDLARPLSDIYHGEVMAEIVRDMVSMNRFFVLRTHGQYQAFYAFGEGEEPNANSGWHEDALSLCAWELGSFVKDWTHVTMTVDDAVDIIETVCAGRD